MATVFFTRAANCLALLVAAAAIGCGGGGGSSVGGTTALPKVLVSWAARTRALNAPASALSAVVTLVGANPKGGDFTFEFDRKADPAAYTQTYTSANSANVGKTTANFAFYAVAGGTGAVVATASESVTIAADGTGIADVALSGTIATVTVAAGQTVAVGSSAQLTFSAKDAHGNLVAVSPGSAAWTVASGAADLTLTADGIATGVLIGSPTVVATVDTIASAAAGIQVTAKAPTAFTVAEITGAGAPPASWSIVPLWVNNNGDAVGYMTDTISKQQAFLWKNGAFTAIGDPNASLSGTCVNDSDVVVGNSANSGDFSWQGGNLTMFSGSYLWSPFVNSSGQIIRSIGFNGQGDSRANTYLTTGGVDQLIVFPNNVGFDEGAFGLNDQGEVVGHLRDPNGFERGYVWQHGAFVVETYGSNFNYGTTLFYCGVTNSGQVQISATQSQYAQDFFLGTGGSSIQPMGIGDYYSMHLNNVGQAVGAQQWPYDPLVHAIIWQAANPGTVQDLNSMIPAGSGWILMYANHINDKGQIVGTGRLNGVIKPFILTPSG